MQFSDFMTCSEESIVIGGRPYKNSNGVLKPKKINSSLAQEQTKQTFGFKWKKEETFDSQASLARMKSWLLSRYKNPEHWLSQFEDSALTVLDAGCGAGMSGLEYWDKTLQRINYVGVDISSAVDVASKRFKERGYSNVAFLQESIDNLPFQGPCFDVIFSEGVLHHTDNTQATFLHLCKFLKPGGLFMFYVYRKKGPVREFTDDYIREVLQQKTPEEGWEYLKGLTHLGIELGKLNIDIDLPVEIPVLGIPSGKINLQRLFYWNVLKAFYDPNLTFDEMHHINFDWYAPKNAHRHTAEEVKVWCKLNSLEIKHMQEEQAGITVVAQKI